MLTCLVKYDDNGDELLIDILSIFFTLETLRYYIEWFSYATCTVTIYFPSCLISTGPRYAASFAFDLEAREPFWGMR